MEGFFEEFGLVGGFFGDDALFSEGIIPAINVRNQNTILSAVCTILCPRLDPFLCCPSWMGVVSRWQFTCPKFESSSDLAAWRSPRGFNGKFPAFFEFTNVYESYRSGLCTPLAVDLDTAPTPPSRNGQRRRLLCPAQRSCQAQTNIPLPSPPPPQKHPHKTPLANILPHKGTLGRAPRVRRLRPSLQLFRNRRVSAESKGLWECGGHCAAYQGSGGCGQVEGEEESG